MDYANSAELNRQIAEQSGGACMLAFSCGKDSIVAWLELRRYFKEITPVYMYLVPDLAFVEKSLDYFEKFFGCHIIRMPHPSLYRMLVNLVFQPPEHCAVIEAMQLPLFDYDDVWRVVKEDKRLSPDLFVATGVRSADSPQRHISIATHGAVNEAVHKWFPIYDWRKARVIEELKSSGVRLPIDYTLFGRSFDGLDYRFLKPIHDHLPTDYARILEYFPLAELELKRHEFAEVHNGHAGH